jgi:hypothetical protein
VYYCNTCETSIDDIDIKFDAIADKDACPECGSCDVDYFDADVESELRKKEW